MSDSVVINDTPAAPEVIPAHIAANLLKLLERVQVTGVEAIAWLEAYQFLQAHAPKQPGTPFAGLPG